MSSSASAKSPSINASSDRGATPSQTLRRLAQLLGHASHRVDGEPGLGHPAGLAVVHEQHQVRVDQPFAVAQCLDDGEHLGRDGIALGGVLRPPDGPVASGKGVAQRRQVVQLPGDLHRLEAERRAVIASVRGAPPRAGESAEEEDPQAPVATAEHHQRVLQQRDQPRVPSGSGPRQAAAVPEGGLRQVLAGPGPARGVGGQEEGDPGALEIAGARLDLPERQQDLRARSLIGRRRSDPSRRAPCGRDGRPLRRRASGPPDRRRAAHSRWPSVRRARRHRWRHRHLRPP